MAREVLEARQAPLGIQAGRCSTCVDVASTAGVPRAPRTERRRQDDPGPHPDGLLRPTGAACTSGGVDLTPAPRRDLARRRGHRVRRDGASGPSHVEEHLALAGRRAGRTGRRGASPTLRALARSPSAAVLRRAALRREQQMLATPARCSPTPCFPRRALRRAGPVHHRHTVGRVHTMTREGSPCSSSSRTSLAFAVSDEVAVMARGTIVHSAATAAFRRDPRTARRLLGVEG